MSLSPLAVLIGWMPVGIYLFRRYPVRVAILANFLGGWALLPGANYTPTAEVFPYWILGVCLPTDYFLTKATVTGLAGLGGMLFFYSGDLKRIRLGVCDIPMAVWCCVPLISTVAHWNTLREGLFGAAYQTISWGVPWLLGRTYFSDHDSLLLAAKAFVVAGVAYVPVCLMEICVGPQLYGFLYGYQPYRWIGAERYLGYRPIGLLEDGNQLGIWMAAATLIAVCLFALQHSNRIFGLSLGWIAAGLAVTTLLCQSVGSILLLLFLIPLTRFRQRSVLRASVAVLVLCIVAFAAFRMTNLVSLRALAKRNGTVHSIAEGLASIGRQSFAWRIARDESHIAMALRNPLLGSGQWNWWQGEDSRPWSLWLLVFGMYGLVGLTAFGSIMFLPIIRSVWATVDGDDRDDSDIRVRRTLVALILMVALDNLLNGAMILPYLLAMGGLASRKTTLVVSAEQFRTDRRLVRSREFFQSRFCASPASDDPHDILYHRDC
jgi:hypothetical protein